MGRKHGTEGILAEWPPLACWGDQRGPVPTTAPHGISVLAGAQKNWFDG